MTARHFTFLHSVLFVGEITVGGFSVGDIDQSHLVRLIHSAVGCAVLAGGRQVQMSGTVAVGRIKQNRRILGSAWIHWQRTEASVSTLRARKTPTQSFCDNLGERRPISIILSLEIMFPFTAVC